MGWHLLKVWLKNGRSLTLKSDKGPSTQEQLSKSKSGGSAVVVHQWRALTPELDLPVYQSCCCYRTTLNWGVRWMPPSSQLKLGVPNPWILEGNICWFDVTWAFFETLTSDTIVGSGCKMLETDKSHGAWKLPNRQTRALELNNDRKLTLKADKGPSTQEQLSKSKSGAFRIYPN